VSGRLDPCPIVQSLILWHNPRFRWAELQLAKFFGPNSCMDLSEDVKDALEKLEKEVGDPDLNKVYSEIYNMNTKSKSNSRAIAIKAFKWMMCAQRPLQIIELAEAVSADERESLKREINDEYILKICSNFIIADASNIAQFAHLSVREYLESRESDGVRKYSQEQAHKQVAETCLAYLTHPLTPISSIRYFRFGLPSYSVLYWTTHWEKACENRGSGCLGQLFAQFLAEDKADSSLIDWVQVLARAVESLSWEQFSTRTRLQAAISSSPTTFFAACEWGFSEVLCNSSTISTTNLTELNRNGMPGLIIAAGSGHEEVVRLLLDRGADVAAKTEYGWTALHWAAESGHEAVMRLLLDQGADIAAKDERGRTALHWAAENGHEAVVRLLLDQGADIAAKDGEGRTALHWAAESGHEAVVRLLLDQGADVAANDGEGWTALHCAAGSGHEAVVRLLLDQGADVAAKDGEGWTALHCAAENGHEAVVRLLLDQGADVAAKDGNGWTALHSAAGKGHEAVVRLLLDQGADVAAKDEDGWTALHSAAGSGHEAVVRLLLDRGADVAAKDGNGGTALHSAAGSGHEAVVRLLLDRGADVAAKTSGGWTALHSAASSGHEAVVRLLTPLTPNS
jgi:ankyrin repeat protein